MSGNYVQRGEPAVFDKGVRARAAVDAGEVDAGRYERYQILFEEMKTRWKERYD